MALAIALAVSPLGGGESTAKTRGFLAKEVSPGNGAVVPYRTLRVRVRLSKNARSFSARLNTTNVTRSFRRRGTLRTASLGVRGKGLQRGLNYLYIRSVDRAGRPEVKISKFLAARRSGSFLSVRVSRRRSAGQLPVRLRVRQRSARVALRLNGRRVRVPRSGRVRRLTLDGDEGLRYGVNRISVHASSRSGVYALANRGVRVASAPPIPAAGPDRRGVVGRRATLTARNSKARRGRKLSYRWTIARRPRGTRPRLAGARRSKALLAPRTPGRYRLRLTVREAGRRAPVSRDTVGVTATPDVPPIGLAIDTLARSARGTGVAVGAPVNQTYYPSNGTDTLQLVAFDRTTLESKARSSYAGSDAGTSALAKDAAALGNSQIAVITTPQAGKAAPTADATALANLNSALAKIGAKPVDSSVKSFSAIGIPGADAATDNHGLTLMTPAGDTTQPGGMRGYLQSTNSYDSSGNLLDTTYHYVSGDYQPFDTQAQGSSPTQAVVTVAGKTYRSQALAPNQRGGFFILVLDSGTLEHIDDTTLPILDGTYSGQLESIDNFLSQYGGGGASDPHPEALVIVQSVGAWVSNPASDLGTGKLGPWDDVALDLANLGGSIFLFNALNTPQPLSGYTQVGPGIKDYANYDCCLSPWTKTASWPATRTTNARLTGVLSRNEHSLFTPELSGVTPEPDYDLPAVAYQAPTPWPLRGTTQGAAAIKCVTDYLDLPPGPIERNYWANDNISWLNNKTQVEDLTYAKLTSDANCPKAKFTAGDLTNVTGQLATEFGYVEQIKNHFIPNLQAPFTANSTLSAYTQFTSTVADVGNAVANSNKPTTGNGLEIFSSILDVVASVLPEKLPLVKMAGIMGSASLLGSDFISEQDGSPADEITEKGPALGTALVSRYTKIHDQMATIGDQLVSDWGKLKAAYAKTNDEWAIDGDDIQRVQGEVGVSARAFAYNHLFPLGYKLYGFSPDVQPNKYTCHAYPKGTLVQLNWRPFANVPASATTYVLGDDERFHNRAYGSTDGSFINEYPPRGTGLPPASLTSEMFVGSAEDPAPVSPLRFFMDNYASTGVPTVKPVYDVSGDEQGCNPQ